MVCKALASLSQGLPLDPLPPPAVAGNYPGYDSVPHAPVRVPNLSAPEKKLALKNALRYFPSDLHAILAPEFAQELETEGHIYMRRFMPTHYEMKARAIEEYPAKSRQAAAIMLMIMNNLDPKVAQYPHELITYGGNGSVFSNWAQYHLTMQMLSRMNDKQTLSMVSGHPQGLFPSSPEAPRVVITNGMVVPNYSGREQYEKMYAMGNSMYGQMTAGSYCYIGPQGIVHGTTLTILNAARKYLGVSGDAESMKGKVYLSSGLGGMSGAQAKAAVICGAIGVLAEIDPFALKKRHEQGWVDEVVVEGVEVCIRRIKEAKAEGKPLSIGFLGNVVSLWEGLVCEEECLVEMGSDQTSLHNPYSGGYYPVQLSFEESREMMAQDPEAFKKLVQESLRRHVSAINTLTARGGFWFWDYGNCFLLEASRANADIMATPSADAVSPEFRYPSYVQHVMGEVFSLGFGPFRWVCSSGLHADLVETDRLARHLLKRLRDGAPPQVAAQYADNLRWIEAAESNQLVVGSEARILYCDAEGRKQLAKVFNEAVSSGLVTAPIIISRDHHDVSGTDSPFRETSNVYDGSAFCADMSVQNVIGDAFRGATWVSIHNGGGVGWGEVMNGGFGLVLDGSEEAERRSQSMLDWDVNNGIARRSWSGHPGAKFAIERAMQANPELVVTVAQDVSNEILDGLF